jgi:predicted AlkP superfamily pyrophosphatase or phosphodiesterase
MEWKALLNTEHQQAKRLLVISLDGLDARYLLKRDEAGLRLPTLRRLLAEGAWSLDVQSVYPSVTYPVHTTIATGALPARHGIYGNNLLEPPCTKQTGQWHWFARDIRADTLWAAAAREGLRTGLISWPVASGAGDYNVPEILDVGKPLRETLALMKAHARPPGLIEELESKDPQLYRFANQDEHDDLRARFAAYVIEEKRPDVMLVHFFDFDHFQHDYGPFAPEATACLEKLDGYVARLLDACARAGTLDETALFIVSDHGFMPISKLVHPHVLLARAGLLRVDSSEDGPIGLEKMKDADWRAYAYITSGSCAIILRDPSDVDAKERVRALFEPLAGLEGSGILRVFRDEEMRLLCANPDASLMLEAADGYSFGPNLTGDAVTESLQRGQHGYLPTRADYLTCFIATGAGIERRGDLGRMRMIDVGPTIARVLGFSLKDAEGEGLQLR